MKAVTLEYFLSCVQNDTLQRKIKEVKITRPQIAVIIQYGLYYACKLYIHRAICAFF